MKRFSSTVSHRLWGSLSLVPALLSCGPQSVTTSSDNLSARPRSLAPACETLPTKNGKDLTTVDFAQIDACENLKILSTLQNRPTQERCDAIASEIDRLPDLNALPEFLKRDTKQDVVRDLFLCAPETEQVPNDALNEDLLRGDGWGSLYANKDVPFWNNFQFHVGRLVWGGKVLHRKSNGEVYLRNMMMISKTMAFEAKVYVSQSIIDQRKTLTLDYRDDSTVGLLSEKAIRRVRDELRELPYRGQGSNIFVGRANIFTGKLSELKTDKFSAAENFFFGANFILDFRPELQKNIPAWARQPL